MPSDAPIDLQERYDRLRELYEVTNIIHSTLDPQQALQLILREATRLTGANSGSIVLLNPTTGFLEIEASCGLPPSAEQLKLRLGEGITGSVAKTGKPARVSDVRRDPHYVCLRHDVRSELAVPFDVEDQTRGVINVDSDRTDAFTERHQELLETLASHAARVIHHTWLYQQIRQRAQLFESLATISQAINSTLNLDDALRAITREAASLMHAKLSALHLLDSSGDWLERKASHGAGPAYMGNPRLAVDESVLGIVVRRRKPLQIDNVQTSAVYQHVDVARREGLVSLLSVPLLFGGEVTGTLSVYTAAPYSFSNEEIRILTALAELSALAMEKARLYECVVDIEEQLRQNERLSALGLLAAEVAHEIRNPLTVMKMLYHSLDIHFPPEDPRATDIRILGEKMDTLNATVERILDLARGIEPQMRLVNVNDLVENLFLLVRHKLNAQAITLTKQLEPSLPSISADPVQLEQVFLNLILNATQAMNDGGTLTLTTESRPSCIIITIRDTGHGMTQEQRERAFSSLLKSTKRGGTGLGLAIVRRIVETHRGTIDIGSEPGQGTTIAISLPLTS